MVYVHIELIVFLLSKSWTRFMYGKVLNNNFTTDK